MNSLEEGRGLPGIPGGCLPDEAAAMTFWVRDDELGLFRPMMEDHDAIRGVFHKGHGACGRG